MPKTQKVATETKTSSTTTTTTPSRVIALDWQIPDLGHKAEGFRERTRVSCLPQSPPSKAAVGTDLRCLRVSWDSGRPTGPPLRWLSRPPGQGDTEGFPAPPQTFC